MRYYFVSDLHGNYSVLDKLEDYITKNESFKLFILGDLIDDGINSYKTLYKAYQLQKKYGKDKIIVIRGNHEEAFISYLKGEEDSWLYDDRGFATTKTFLTDVQMNEVMMKAKNKDIAGVYSYVRKSIVSNHKELVTWLYKLPYYYETETQIIVHAGIDEEAEDLWSVGTPDYYFVGKYPATTGYFYKDIIAGHVSSAAIANDDKYLGKVFFDTESHYYIDGTINKSYKLPVLVYDSKSKKYSSFSLSVEEYAE